MFKVQKNSIVINLSLTSYAIADISTYPKGGPIDSAKIQSIPPVSTPPVRVV